MRFDKSRMLSSSGTLVEGDVGSARYWQDLLDLDALSFSNLIAANILRKVPGADHFRMDFVGLISGQRKAFFVLPKVFDPARREIVKEDIGKVLRCIQRYERRVTRRRQQNIGAVESLLFTEGGTLLNLFLSILGWTRDHGLHLEDQTAIVSDPAQVDWAETFQRSLTLHFPTGIAFSTLYGRDHANSHDKLALAQAMALIDLMQGLGMVSRLWISEYDPIIESCWELLRQASAEDTNLVSIRWAIQDADLHATRDHDRALISSLRQWIEGRTTRGNRLSFYGVNAFHVVWEDMCEVALRSSQLSHGEIASQPFFVGGSKRIPLGDQIPDFLVKRGNGVVIADAKWYRVWRDEFPGSPDVIKQMMYESSVASEIAVVGNAFVVPIPDRESAALEILGGISMEGGGVTDERFPLISVVGVKWDVIADCYISGAALPQMIPSLMLPRSTTADAATAPSFSE